MRTAPTCPTACCGLPISTARWVKPTTRTGRPSSSTKNAVHLSYPTARSVSAGAKKAGGTASLDPSVPHVHFAFGASHLLALVKEAGGDVLGLDWRTDIDEAWKTLNHETGVQGNLDPVALYGSREYIKRRVKDILGRAGNRNGHIFNLGHGILPTVPPDNAKYMIDL